MQNPLTKKRIIRYQEGIYSARKNHPKVISGEIPRIRFYISREEWTWWKYWTERIVDRYFGLLQRHVPFLRSLIFETYERHYYPIFRADKIERVLIREDQATEKWQKLAKDLQR